MPGVRAPIREESSFDAHRQGFNVRFNPLKVHMIRAYLCKNEEGAVSRNDVPTPPRAIWTNTDRSLCLVSETDYSRNVDFAGETRVLPNPR